jgi:two-component system chemotaxis sensor kinase CheA
LKFIDTKIEISKDRISLLKDILIHLIQNSVDHGVEEKNDRQKLNKPQIAEITISFAEKESEIEVVVGDDGRGIDVNRISTKAVELNMITPEKLSTLNEVEKLNLIFIPGLSSKVTTSIVSGRGVGMDAVKHMIEEIGGKIFIWSKPGIGTKFTITLPK